MRSIIFRRLGCVTLGLPLACGAAKGGLEDSNGRDGFFSGDADTGRVKAAQSFVAFPGAGTSGAAEPLSASLAPDTSNDCNPQPSPGGSTGVVQTVCFFSADEPDVPAATIEQVVEVVGTAEWVHLRLTLNPDFVDNTYGDTAIGWDGDPEAGAPGAEPAPKPGAREPKVDAPRAPKPDAPDGAAPPPPDGAAPPPPDGAAPPPPAPGGPERAAAGPDGRGGARPGKGGHSFRDLVGSDHAEIELLDGNAEVAMHFKIDYVSESASAASGYASLGVSGGEGKLIVGEPEWVLATATSIDRNLNACGFGSFVESSPATDASYTPSADASGWDYRVAYEVWVSTEAFGDAGFGSAVISNVHASPSKGPGDTTAVLPAPCPVNPEDPDAVPQPVPVVLQTIR
jgi:hypothetical protein